MKNKMDQEYSFALRPASIEEAGLFYSNDEQDEALGTVGHLRLDFGHGFLPLRSTCYPHNDDQFDTLEFKMLLREFLEAMQENGPLASLSSMEAYCQKHGGAITEDGQTYGYIWETERYRFCLRCTPSPFEYQGHLYCYDLWQQQIQKNCPVGQVTYASGEQQTFTVVQHYLQTIREELPYRDTTGFRFETLTDDPKVKTAVDDILLDFAGEENPRRACNYGLTEAGNQALRDAADPDSPHTYAWFVLTDCNTLEEQIFRDLTLEEAIQIYQASDCQEKRIGVTKDEVATVDLVRSLDGEQQFFEDHRKLRSFQNDPFIASAVEKLKQELEQTVETQGFELSSPWTESDLQYQEYSQRMLSAISGLTSYAASLSAKGQDDTVGILRELLIDMCWIWEGYDPISETEMPWDEFLTQYMGPFDEAVEQARHTGNAPGIAPETKEQIFYGIGIHMRELIESCENVKQVRQWMSLAEQMNEEWAGTTQYPLFYQMINGPLWEGEMFKKPIIHLPYDMIPTSIVPKGWHYYHLYRDIKSIRVLTSPIMFLFCVILMAYAVIKVFFANLKRGGILLIQIAVGSLYMFSIPRGYGDAFVQWCKQVIGLCLTAFLQSTILIAGLMVFRENALLGLGLMLSANEVPRIAGTFGLDTTTRANIMSAVYTAQAAVNTTRTIAQAVAK